MFNSKIGKITRENYHIPLSHSRSDVFFQADEISTIRWKNQNINSYMVLLSRLINPVVVAPTVAAVGLAFFSYGFPQAGSCVEISIPQIFLVLLFTLVRI